MEGGRIPELRLLIPSTDHTGIPQHMYIPSLYLSHTHSFHLNYFMYIACVCVLLYSTVCFTALHATRNIIVPTCQGSAAAACKTTRIIMYFVFGSVFLRPCRRIICLKTRRPTLAGRWPVRSEEAKVERLTTQVSGLIKNSRNVRDLFGTRIIYIVYEPTEGVGES